MNVNLNDENGINISSSGDLSLGASGGVSLSGGSVSISGSNKVVVQKSKSSYISLEVECYNQSNAVYENGSCRETYELFTDDDPQNGVQEALAELEYKNELLSLSILGSNVMLNVVMQNDKINDINKSENNNSTIDKSGNSGSDSKSTLKSAFYALGGGISKFSTFARDASLEFGEKVLGLNYDQCAVDSKSNRKLRDMYAEDDRRDAEDYDKLRGKAPNKDIFDNVSKVTSGGLILIDTVIAGHGLINIAKSGISLAKFSGKAQNILKFGDKIANKTKNTVNTIEELNRLKNTNGGINQNNSNYENQSPYSTSKWLDFLNNKYGKEKVSHNPNIKLKEGYYVEHTTGPIEKFTERNGISGGHNYDEFNKYFSNSSDKYKLKQESIVKIPHPEIDGIFDIEYRVEYEKMDYTGKRGTGKYNTLPPERRPPYKKTVYNPEKISNEELIELSKKAVEEGLESGRIEILKNQPKIKIKGQVGYNGKMLKFEACQDINTGIVENAYPVLEWATD